MYRAWLLAPSACSTLAVDDTQRASFDQIITSYPLTKVMPGAVALTAVQ